jgi:2'-5' RNA ligase
VLPPVNLHVTLAFLGMRDADRVDGIAAATRDAAKGLPVPRLGATGLAGVPPRRPRLFAAELDDEEARAAALAAAVGQALAAEGFYEPEERAFWPHVTLARVRRGQRPEQARGRDMPAGAFDTPDVVLYRSVPGGGGARYEPLATERLRPVT